MNNGNHSKFAIARHRAGVATAYIPTTFKEKNKYKDFSRQEESNLITQQHASDTHRDKARRLMQSHRLQYYLQYFNFQFSWYYLL